VVRDVRVGSVKRQRRRVVGAHANHALGNLHTGVCT
jgi:hypothetical protein